MITVRKADERGRSQAAWLDSRHTFSFADYHDPKHMGFRALRVINDDRVAPSAGFGAHSHRDMEIITYVLAGALGHEDSLGHGSTIQPGDVQRMSAGTGVTHSEWNHSKTEPVHFLQVWIVPSRRGIEPSYEQRTFEPEELRDSFRLLASSDGRDGAVTLHQDAELHAAKLSPGGGAGYTLAAGRHAWVHVARGRVVVSDMELGAGDGAAVSGEGRIELTAVEEAEVLLFDLA